MGRPPIKTQPITASRREGLTACNPPTPKSQDGAKKLRSIQRERHHFRNSNRGKKQPKADRA